jgi:hypothetical protein
LALIVQYEPGVIFFAFVPSSPLSQWLVVPEISTASYVPLCAWSGDVNPAGSFMSATYGPFL